MISSSIKVNSYIKKKWEEKWRDAAKLWVETDYNVCAFIDRIAKLRGDEYNLSNNPRVHTPTRRHRMMPSIGMVSNFTLFTNTITFPLLLS